VICGKLLECSSKRENILHLTNGLPGLYRRHYELRVITTARSLRVLTFSIAGRVDAVPVQQGDTLVLLYATRNHRMTSLIAITNQSTGRKYTPPAPIFSRGYVLGCCAALSAVLLVTLLLMSSHLVLSFSLSAVYFAACIKLVDASRLSSPPLRMSVREEAQLMADQQLIKQKSRLEVRIEALQQESQEHYRLSQRLEGLKRKMLEADPQLYQVRIDRAARAVKILQEQILSNQHLLDQYDQTLQMIDIEIETAQVADQLPDAHQYTSLIFDRLEELRQIEAENQGLRLRLEAMDDVRRLRA